MMGMRIKTQINKSRMSIRFLITVVYNLNGSNSFFFLFRSSANIDPY